MKKSFPVNISGHIYYFDEDAYERLNTYYHNLRQAFTGEDGAEIVDDIESRVAEIIAESHSGNGNSVVTIHEITDIITRMGQPEELAGDTVEDNGSSTSEPDESASENESTPPPYSGTQADNPQMDVHPVKRLYRDMNDKVIAGVISGLAYYLGVNITALRVAVVLLALFTWVGPLVALYVLGWLIIPAAVTPRQILEMTGHAVTVDSVGRTTIFGTPDPDAPPRTTHFWEAAGRIVSVVCMSALGMLGLIISISMIVLLICAVAGFITYSGWGYLELAPCEGQPILSLLLLSVVAVAILIPAVSAIWAACTVLFNAKGVTRRTAVIVAVLEVCLIIVAVCLGVGLNAADSMEFCRAVDRFY